MTIGTIDENGESLIRLAVSASAEARPYEVDAVLDTGFEGRLALPRAFIESLNLRQTGHARYVTASGETHRTGTYRTAVAFGGRNVIIDEVIEAADPLAGAVLLWGFRVCLNYSGGGRVTLEEL
jgi:clan AA aspartic protease